MVFEKTPIKDVKRGDKQMLVKAVSQLGTGTLIWLLVKRHKFGLVTAWAIVGTILFIFPAFPQIVLGLMGK